MYVKCCDGCAMGCISLLCVLLGNIEGAKETYQDSPGQP